MEAWSDFFRYDRWVEALETCGIDPAYYTTRERNVDEILPWDHIDMGITKQHLCRELEKAYRGELSPDCLHGCVGCGAARLNGGLCNV